MTNHSDSEARYEDANYASTIGRFNEAFAIYSELSQSRHVGATVALGEMYLRGEGVTQDTQRGLELLELAASLGHSTAAFNLGALHRSGGYGVPIDPEKSRRFFLMAKQLGCKLPIDQYLGG
jgi:TPR repeat protein